MNKNSEIALLKAQIDALDQTLWSLESQNSPALDNQIKNYRAKRARLVKKLERLAGTSQGTTQESDADKAKRRWKRHDRIETIKKRIAHLEMVDMFTANPLGFAGAAINLNTVRELSNLYEELHKLEEEEKNDK